MRVSQDEKIRLLRYAIENAKQVGAVIRNLPRVFCPHVLGTMDLRYFVVAWQFDGYSTIGDLPNWRCFDLDEISSIQVIDGPWHRGFKRPEFPRKFEFELVDAVADSEHLGSIRLVSASGQPWHFWVRGRIGLRSYEKSTPNSV